MGNNSPDAGDLFNSHQTEKDEDVDFLAEKFLIIRIKCNCNHFRLKSCIFEEDDVLCIAGRSESAVVAIYKPSVIACKIF